MLTNFDRRILTVIRRLASTAVLSLILSVCAHAGNLEMAVMNVGQGDGVLITLPSGKHALIDAGWDARYGVMPYLRAKGVERIEYVVMSHPHADHIGGIRSILEMYDVDVIYDCGLAHTSATYRNILTTIQERGITYIPAKAGTALDWDTNVTVRVLHPDHPGHSNINDNSIVLHLQYKDVAFLLTGDAELDAERTILNRFGKNMRADVLKVAHHGSRTSSSEAFVAAVAPKFAFISCGEGNSFGHPRRECLETLTEAGAKIFRTDLAGYLIASTDGKTVTTKTSFLPFSAARIDGGRPVAFDTAGWIRNRRARAKPGETEPIAIEPARLVLTADPGRNIWSMHQHGPYLIRPVPQSAQWTLTAQLDFESVSRSSAGLMLFSDTANYLLAGVNTNGEFAVDLFRGGQHDPLSMKLAIGVSGIGFRKTADGLDVLAQDADDSIWKTVFRYKSAELPFDIAACRAGPFAANRTRAPIEATFRAYTEY